jgi:hypothetical protein
VVINVARAAAGVQAHRVQHLQCEHNRRVCPGGWVNSRRGCSARMSRAPCQCSQRCSELERRGLISRIPRQARSIAVAVPPDEIPQLRRQSIESNPSANGVSQALASSAYSWRSLPRESALDAVVSARERAPWRGSEARRGPRRTAQGATPASGRAQGREAWLAASRSRGASSRDEGRRAG